MSKAISYYDWELSFKKKPLSSTENKEKEENSLGIPNMVLKNFLSEWKEKNL